MELRRASYHRRRQVFTVLAGFALCGYSQQSAPSASTTDPAPDSQELPSAEASNPLQVWLNALARAESGNREHLVHRDRDGQLYYGCLQFQARTFRVYARKLGLLPASGRSDLMSRIYDCGFQKRLAAAMIRDDPSNWKHWRLTVEKKVGLPPPSAEHDKQMAVSEAIDPEDSSIAPSTKNSR